MPKIDYIDINADKVTGEPRPRFNPSPGLRRLGYRRRNLQHEDGTWFTLGEALDFSLRIKREAAAKRAGIAAGMKRAGMKRPRAPLYTVQQLLADWQDPKVNPRFRPEGEQRGKLLRKGLAAASKRDYAQKARVLEAEAPEMWALPVDALDQPIVVAVYEDIWTKRGLASARGAMATLSAAISWGKRRGKVRLAVNPCLKMGMEMPPPRVNVATPAQIRALVKAADELRDKHGEPDLRPEIGDMIVLAVWTGQRQRDRLPLLDRGLDNGKRFFRQSKTGKIVAIPQAPELEARLHAAAKRRRDAQIVDPHVILDEKHWRPFKARHYNRVLQAVKQAAATATGDNEIMGLTDQDLRDTAVTWLARGGCTIPEICSITGHEAESAVRILRHYLDLSEGLAETAIAKVVSWYEGEAQ